MICPICGQPARFIATTMSGQVVTGRSYYHEGEIHHEGAPLVPPPAVRMEGVTACASDS